MIEVEDKLPTKYPDQREQLHTVTGLAHHVKARTIQQTGQTLPEQHIVLGQNHT